MARPITQLTDSFKIFRDNVNTISVNVGDPDLLTTTTRASQRSDSSDVVSALNELDSDLHGAGGGDVKNDLNYVSYAINTVRDSGMTGAVNAIDAFIGGDSDSLNVEANTIKDAINEIEAVFDASKFKIDATAINQKFRFDGASGLEVNVDSGDIHFLKDSNQYAELTLGTTSVLDFTVAGQITTADSAGGNFEIDAGGDITLDAAGDNIIFKDDGSTRINHTLGDSNTVGVTGHYTVDATQNIYLDADGGNWYLRDNGTTDFHFNTSGEIIRSGTITLQANGEGVVLDAGGTSLVNTGITFQAGGTDKINYTFASGVAQGYTGALLDSVEGDHVEKIHGDQTVTVDSDYTLNADSATVSTARNFKVDAGSNIVLDADGGNVIIQDGGVEDYRFNTNGTVSRTGNFTVDVTGDITLDADGGDVYLKDGGTTNYQFATDGTISRTGDLEIDVSGDITLDADGGQIVFQDSDAKFTFNFGNDQEVDVVGTLTMDVEGDIVLDAGGGDVFFRDDGAIYGSLANTGGNLLVRSGSTTALTFSGANVTTSGTVTTGGNLIMGGANIQRTGALTLDVSGNISLDADGGNVYLKDGGTTYGALKNSGGDLVIRNRSADHVTFDSAAKATFVGNIVQGTSLNTSSGHLGGAINEVHDELDSASSDLQTTKGRVTTLESEMDSNESRIGVSVQWNVDNPYSWVATTSNRSAINDLDSAVGTLSALDGTTFAGANDKDNVVVALNVLAADVQDLQDSAGTLDSRIGSLANLAAFFDSAGATSSIVNALNHMASRVVDIYDESGTLLNT